MAVFVFLLTAAVVSALPECPLWDCLELNSTVCARVEYDQVFINDEGCDNNQHCELDGVLMWLENKRRSGDTSGEYI
jgi:hypothetical protein